QQAGGETFHVLFSADGPFSIEYGNKETETVATGTSVLIPAQLRDYTIRAPAGTVVLKITNPMA
ncbi:MAG: hypothetical protein HKP10_08070, partial [Kiritimatiellales bacterium]|nr:hypothetical protein [Kiritimatiellales bacterium]